MCYTNTLKLGLGGVWWKMEMSLMNEVWPASVALRND